MGDSKGFVSMGGSRRISVAGLFAALLMVFCLCACSAGSSSGGQANGAGEDESTPAVVTVGVPAEKIGPDEVASGEPTSEGEGELADGTDSADAGDDVSDDLTDGDRLIVRFIDVGQGDCALITCGGQSLLVDGGPSGASSKVYSILKRLEISNIDYVVATHPDADHIGGLSGALTASTCGAFFCSTQTSDTKTFESLLSRVERQGLSVQVPAAGDSFALGGATVTFVGPVEQDPDSENNNSLVLRVVFGSTSFLLTGDAEEEEEQSLVAAGVDLSADVLKVAHHGSSSSSTRSFLRRVNPTYAVISVGENSYGHPTESTINRLESVGAQILRTDESGSVIIASDGASILVTTTKGVIDE